ALSGQSAGTIFRFADQKDRAAESVGGNYVQSRRSHMSFRFVLDQPADEEPEVKAETKQTKAKETRKEIRDSGREFLRRALYVETTKGILGRHVSEVQVGIAALDDFAHGRTELDSDALARVARVLFDAEYDAASDRLSRKPPPVLPTAVTP